MPACYEQRLALTLPILRHLTTGFAMPKPSTTPNPYGTRRAGRHVVMTTIHTDCYLQLRQFMDAHNLSASGAVHHLLRERFNLQPLPPFN